MKCRRRHLRIIYWYRKVIWTISDSMEKFAEAMAGIYSESVVEAVRDEAPMAYKDADRIAAALEPTAELVEWLDAVHNLKSTD